MKEFGLVLESYIKVKEIINKLSKLFEKTIYIFILLGYNVNDSSDISHRRRCHMGKVLTKLYNKLRGNKKHNTGTIGGYKIKFGILQKLILGFIIPVALIVFLGIISYSKASEGLISNYELATENSFDMASSYMGYVFEAVDALSQQYTNDNDLDYFTRGLTYTNKQERLSFVMNNNNKLLTKTNLERFIENIHIIPRDNVPVLTSDMENIMGFYTDIESSLQGKQTIWIGSHPLIDDKISLDKEAYAMSFIRKFENEEAIIAIDISRKEVETFLSELSLGDNSLVGIVTGDGSEIVIRNQAKDLDQSVEQVHDEKTEMAEVGGFSFYEQGYFAESIVAEQQIGAEYVDYDGQEHLFMYSKIGDTGITICGMVPKASFMQQANDIKLTTVIVVVIACIVAVSIGFTISNGIGKNIRHIIEKLQNIAEGDLTVQVAVNRKDEFAILAGNITDMLNNMRKLIQKMSNVSGLVSNSAKNVMKASQTISNSSANITDAVDDITSGIEGQANDSQNCLSQMDDLSKKITVVNSNLEEIEELMEEMSQIVSNGINTMENLANQSQETNRITKYVVDNITALEEKTKSIGEIINVMNDIADQTNLLSLNASIEAARAGDVGKGFAVVATEIRKLASKSMESADEIRGVISEIVKQTAETVGTAREAEDVVDKQNDIVNHTIQAFQNMNSGLDRFIYNLSVISNNVKNMEEARKGTLSAVQNISAVSEETLATSCSIEKIVDAQSESVKELDKASNELVTNAKDLDEAVNMFVI